MSEAKSDSKSVRILFSNGSVHDTTAECDSMGVHYTVSTTKGVTTLTRWDSKTNSEIHIGQCDLSIFKPDKVRLGEAGEWEPLANFLSRTQSHFFIHDRTFKGNDGATYVWKTRFSKWGQLVMTYDASNTNKEPLIIYHRHQMSKKPTCLEICDTTVLGGLDNIILAFLIMEKRRRDRQRARQRGVSSGR